MKTPEGWIKSKTSYGWSSSAYEGSIMPLSRKAHKIHDPASYDEAEITIAHVVKGHAQFDANMGCGPVVGDTASFFRACLLLDGDEDPLCIPSKKGQYERETWSKDILLKLWDLNSIKWELVEEEGEYIYLVIEDEDWRASFWCHS